MGILRSTYNHSGLTVGPVRLGVPALLVDGHAAGPDDTPDEYAWEDALLPSGTISSDGTVTASEEVG